MRTMFISAGYIQLILNHPKVIRDLLANYSLMAGFATLMGFIETRVRQSGKYGLIHKNVGIDTYQLNNCERYRQLLPT